MSAARSARATASGPPEASWYRAVENALAGLGADWARFAALGPRNALRHRSKSLRGPRESSCAKTTMFLRTGSAAPAPGGGTAAAAARAVVARRGRRRRSAAGAGAARGGASAAGCSTPCSSGCRAPRRPSGGRCAADWLEHSAGVADAAARAALADDACADHRRSRASPICSAPTRSPRRRSRR